MCNLPFDKLYMRSENVGQKRVIQPPFKKQHKQIYRQKKSPISGRKNKEILLPSCVCFYGMVACVILLYDLPNKMYIQVV